ncbi:UDP-N-acetylmuramate--L-alanine ligase [Patescibacteria group bacterium]|nr:UDP-N-acetylmuramate--L-alanine ligase [Patescibacteria group bacterium]
MLENISKIHLIGAGGIGVSAVGKWLIAKGKEVTATDLYDTEISRALDAAGAVVHIGPAPDMISEGIDLVVYSSAVPESDSERVKARKLGIKELSYAEFLGEMSREYSTIVVSGTNGKSTTTAILGLILEEAGLDPTVIVGSKVPSWEHGNLRVGSGECFVVEGCEYKANMLQLDPSMIVLTNIEEDHLDFYRDLNHIRETFQTFVDKLPEDGILVRNIDDPESMKLKTDKNDQTYSIGHQANFVADNREVEPGKQSFDLTHGSKKLGTVEMQVPAKFNVSNALAATAAATKLGVDEKAIKSALKKFSGIWRRYERVGDFTVRSDNRKVVKEVPVISDYAHHPTAIEQTLNATREFFPNKRVLVCFQPHQHARTIELFDDFVPAFDQADELIISEIYDVAGRDAEAEEISSRKLVKAIKKHDAKIGFDRHVIYAEDLEAAEKEVRDRVHKHDVVIVMGAGDIDEVARNVTK